MLRLSRLVLGAVLAAGLAVNGARAAEPDKLLPAEADTVVCVNVKQLLDSDIAKKYALEQIKQVLEGKDAQKFLGDLGLDPLKDIDKVVVGAEVKGRNDMKFLMIVHGSFKPDQLYKAAESQSKKEPDKFAMVKDGDTVIFKFTPENGQPPVYGTVVNEKTVIAGSDKKMIATALKASESAKKAAIKQELHDLVKKVDEKSSVYAVGIVKGKFEELQLPRNDFIDLSKLQKALPLTNSVAVSVKVAADVNVEVTLGMKDADAADEMRVALDEALKVVKALAPLAGAGDPRAKPLGDVLNTIRTSAKEKDVVVTGKVTGANIGRMMRKDGD